MGEFVGQTVFVEPMETIEQNNELVDCWKKSSRRFIASS